MKKIMVLAAVVALGASAVALPGAEAAPNTRGKGAQRTLTVATYNIHHAAGIDGVLDLERVAQVLEDTEAEVIGLQEVDNRWGTRSEYVDQAAWLAERLGMHYCYTANLDNPPAPGQTANRQYGTAILSEYELDDCTSTPLTNHHNGEQRSLAQADVKVRGVDFRFYNTHLTHNSTAGRLRQAAEINRLIADDLVPGIVVGDMNATPDSTTYDSLTAYLRDAWTAGDGEGYTFPAHEPDRRIDYIFTTEDIEATNSEVVSTPASDHLPVVSDVRLPHPSQKNVIKQRQAALTESTNVQLLSVTDSTPAT